MQPPLSTGKANLSLVAFYGDKPPEMEALIRGAQKILHDSLPLAFRKYNVRQVHATLVSLEGLRKGDAIFNANYAQFFGERRIIDFSKAFNLLKGSDFLPFKVILGGYKEHGDYPFTSRGEHPYQRSFSIQGDIAVAIGWPRVSKDAPPPLNRLRRAFNSANILHKYHRATGDIDNDFYFVLGNVITKGVCKTTIQNTHDRMVRFLSCREPLEVTVAREHLRVIAYIDPRAPPETTRSYSLDEAEEKMDEIKSLYRATGA